MNIRNYNIYFSTHTISGIIICALLYVIFFAGSFSFFKHEITAWQKGVSYEANKDTQKDFNLLLDSLRQNHNLQGRDVTFYLFPHSLQASVNMSVSKDTTVSKPQQNAAPVRGRRGGGDATFFSYDFYHKKTGTYAENYDMGEFLYRLHFLAQLNQIPIRIGYPFGYLLAGLVSFLFLFALITGLLLHWDKIVSNFFIFRPWSKWKTVWTDMHTALGVIGFPFQFIFALTGIVLIVNTILILPLSKYLYDGKQEALYQDMGFSDGTTYDYLYKPIKQNFDFDINPYLSEIQKRWKGSEINRIFIKNYGDESMHLIVHAKPHPRLNFSGEGKAIYRIKDNTLIYERDPHTASSYKDKVNSIIYHLHFGDFGGYAVKITFFILGIMGCIVIISGILIWLVARDKNNVPKHKRIFNFWASNIFVAICLTMLPVTAFTFIAIKVNPNTDQNFIYTVYFYSWLILTVFYVIRRNLRVTNMETLLLGSILSITVPICNGIYSNNWIWKTYSTGQSDILFLDLLWIAIAIVSFLSFLKIKNDKEKITAKQSENTVIKTSVKPGPPIRRKKTIS